jgi:5-methylcytosine-specific restriction endonuclease McrA
MHQKFNGACWYCGTRIKAYESIRIDHQTPKCQGGHHEEDNLVLACIHCNSKKGKKNVEEYRARIRFKEATFPVLFSRDQVAWLRSKGFEFDLQDEIVFFGEKS